MNTFTKLSMAVLIGCQALWAVSCASGEKKAETSSPVVDYTAYVDPYIGSGNTDMYLWGPAFLSV